MTTIRCVLVGCGMVADEYARTLRRSRTVDLVACADIDHGRAAAFADRHAIPEAVPLERLEADLVIVLTPPTHHLEIGSAVVRSGMPVYLEKPLALSSREAEALLTLADQHGVLVGAAPDTFLAPPAQAAADAITHGLIGQPVAATAALLSPGPERWHPAPEPIYALGPLLDMGPYYLSTLIYLLGPIAAVHGAAAACRPIRAKASGALFTATAPTHVDAVLQTTTGISITMTSSFDVQATMRPHLEIYGTDGTLILPDPNFHTGAVRLRRRDEDTWHTLPQPPPALDVIGRSMGVLDIAQALRTGHPTHATGDLALHVLHVAEAIRQAAATGARCAVRPASTLMSSR
ncbi:Gfo/Idh/MocA family protein [Thermoactinospora rubra]|uniref:Gfo/Idh/MocA family protein n=1 Tax=Thermoactinospora rubra TaxID=1088767 RepID=UPI000A0F809B|nr:Gfo/Idh/MocA family oxidoreductase [Thermoactinospora rubra]